MKQRKRVVCVGNELCHDDGLAAAIGRILESSLDTSQVEVVFAAEFGLSTLDAFLDVQQVVVVDAIATGGAPGTCCLHEDLSFIPSATCSIG
ncbi:MAG TPA: hydrogenase maturation protease, partial [Polyangiaceae bacterium]|nr:hydrogenase maturation protease [Polyangiaceae bacterium]